MLSMTMLLMLPRSKLRNHGRGWLWPPWRKTSSCRRNAASLSLQIVLIDLVDTAVAAAMIVCRVLLAPAARARWPSPILLHQHPRAHHHKRHIVVALPERLCYIFIFAVKGACGPPCDHVQPRGDTKKPAGPADSGLYGIVILYVSIPGSLPRVAGAPP